MTSDHPSQPADGTAATRADERPDDPAGGSATAPGTAPADVAALRAALARTVRIATLLSLAGGTLTAVVAGVVAGWPGVWGAVVGVAIAFLFLATTALVGSRVVGGDPLVMAAAVLGSWLLKVVVLGGVVLALRDATFYDTGALVAGIVLGVAITLWAETRELLAARVSYVDTSSR